MEDFLYTFTDQIQMEMQKLKPFMDVKIADCRDRRIKQMEKKMLEVTEEETK